MIGIKITIPPTAQESAVVELLDQLGLHGVVPDNLIEITDEGDCWAVTSWIVEGLKVRMFDGEPRKITVRYDKTRR